MNYFLAIKIKKEVCTILGTVARAVCSCIACQSNRSSLLLEIAKQWFRANCWAMAWTFKISNISSALDGREPENRIAADIVPRCIIPTTGWLCQTHLLRQLLQIWTILRKVPDMIFWVILAEKETQQSSFCNKVKFVGFCGHVAVTFKPDDKRFIVPRKFTYCDSCDKTKPLRQLELVLI